MAAGASAGTLHYIGNDQPFPQQPTVLLVDAGAEYKGYAADVTRCIPVGNGGRFTKECKEIYELVLSMQDVRALVPCLPSCTVLNQLCLLEGGV